MRWEIKQRFGTIGISMRAYLKTFLFAAMADVVCLACDGHTDVIRLANGTEFKGEVIGRDAANKETTIVIDGAGKITFRDDSIASIHAEAPSQNLPLQASQYYETGKFDEAIALAEQALAENPGLDMRGGLFMTLSSCYLEKGIEPYAATRDASCYLKSIEYAEKCLLIQPHQWQALGNIATVHMNMNNPLLADAFYTRAEQYADRNSPYYAQLQAQHGEVRRRLQTGPAPQTTLRIAMDASWDPSPSTGTGHPVYAKGQYLKFAVRVIEHVGQSAQQWAMDEARQLENSKPEIVITQTPKEVQYAGRRWYQIRYDSGNLIHGMQTASVQWYTRDRENIVEAFLIGPSREVKKNMHAAESALAGMEVIER